MTGGKNHPMHIGFLLSCSATLEKLGKSEEAKKCRKLSDDIDNEFKKPELKDIVNKLNENDMIMLWNFLVEFQFSLADYVQQVYPRVMQTMKTEK